eukprot:GHVL01039248.1.p1 GENE.GHVL01039248.1~~GHVL01039248.1.p1  ORF type:complete len:436 (+),score=53.15 GHVL01039248.1:722-2029(+)
MKLILLLIIFSFFTQFSSLRSDRTDSVPSGPTSEKHASRHNLVSSSMSNVGCEVPILARWCGLSFGASYFDRQTYPDIEQLQAALSENLVSKSKISCLDECIRDFGKSTKQAYPGCVNKIILDLKYKIDIDRKGNLHIIESLKSNKDTPKFSDLTQLHYCQVGCWTFEKYLRSAMVGLKTVRTSTSKSSKQAQLQIDMEKISKFNWLRSVGCQCGVSTDGAHPSRDCVKTWNLDRSRGIVTPHWHQLSHLPQDCSTPAASMEFAVEACNNWTSLTQQADNKEIDKMTNECKKECLAFNKKKDFGDYCGKTLQISQEAANSIKATNRSSASFCFEGCLKVKNVAIRDKKCHDHIQKHGPYSVDAMRSCAYQKADTPSAAYDGDSLIGFTRSLACQCKWDAKQKTRVCPAEFALAPAIYNRWYIPAILLMIALTANN